MRSSLSAVGSLMVDTLTKTGLGNFGSVGGQLGNVGSNELQPGEPVGQVLAAFLRRTCSLTLWTSGHTQRLCGHVSRNRSDSVAEGCKSHSLSHKHRAT